MSGEVTASEYANMHIECDSVVCLTRIWNNITFKSGKGTSFNWRDDETCHDSQTPTAQTHRQDRKKKKKEKKLYRSHREIV